MAFDSWCLLRLHIIYLYLYDQEKAYKRRQVYVESTQ